MKKVIFLNISICIASILFAQPRKVYCEIHQATKGMGLTTKTNIVVNFGQVNKFTSNHKLVDESGKPISFESMVDALNYMAAQGWDFVQAYNMGNNATAFILSKELQEGETIELTTKSQSKQQKRDAKDETQE